MRHDEDGSQQGIGRTAANDGNVNLLAQGTGPSDGQLFAVEIFVCQIEENAR